jgi:hypothetical protein
MSHPLSLYVCTVLISKIELIAILSQSGHSLRFVVDSAMSYTLSTEGVIYFQVASAQPTQVSLAPSQMEYVGAELETSLPVSGRFFPADRPEFII